MDPQTLSIKPWDRSSIHKIAKAITESWMWLNPQTMWDWIIIKMPTPTQERRIELVKYAKKLAEEAKIWIRNARQDSLKDIKKSEDDKEISEDIAKKYNEDLQKMVDEWNKMIDSLLKKKEEEIMKI
jgi:ribosome recycling factor